MKRYEEDFKSKLVGLDFDTIENSPHSIFGLSKELKLIYYNNAWLQFSKTINDDSCISVNYPLGTSVEDAMSGTLKDFYIFNYKKVLNESKVWTHEYECSAVGVYRLFYQEVFPLKNGEGIIVVNSIRTEKYIQNVNALELTNLKLEYTDLNGMITQCSNCRKTQRINEKEIWDWVPTFLSETHEHVSHSICPICFDYYWSKK
jgi:hypothetical protein